MSEYREFLAAKVRMAERRGVAIDRDEIHPLLKPHQAAAVQWAVAGGRRAIFAAFGLGKTLMQIEILRLLLKHEGGGRALIIAPLGVRAEFIRDAKLVGQTVTFIRRIEEAGTDGLYITNYETVRDKKLDPNEFIAVSLDEAAILRGFGGTKTFRNFMAQLAGDDRESGIKTDGIKYRFVATATPSPNQYIELLAYAAFLGIMDVGQGKTRFFKRDSTKADTLTIHPHKEREFWLWCASWALFVQKPSDLGYSDDGYVLPPIEVHWHEVPSDHTKAGEERNGQQRMFRNAAIGVSESAREKRDTLAPRIAKMLELRALDPGAHRLLWHDLEAERHAIEKAVPSAVSVYGSQDLEERELSVAAFSDGKIQELAAKPVLCGSGCNFQRHCSWAIFMGIGFKFHEFIQAIHRIQRFLQTKPVRIDLIYTEAEREIRRILEAKWARHIELVEAMQAIIQEYGLNEIAMASMLQRTIGVTRREAGGHDWRMVNEDCVEETAKLESASVGLVLTSIPFATQYEYTPSYNDFGHTDTNDHFFEQMDFLTPELFRVLQPGRVAAIHVKDRITPGGLTGYGFQTLQPFHCETIAHYIKHGFAFLGMKTIVTDVVRENNQTYRLGWTEQCKDGSRMGVGVPEYLLLFRKPQSDRSTGYADVPVVKPKRRWSAENERWENPAGYSRAKWQMDAHAFMRSSGNRLLMPEDLVGLEANVVYKKWREHSKTTVYDFDHHVACAERLEEQGSLPRTFMLLPPHSWHRDVWTDVTRMRTLNGAQHAAGREMHICPLQFDIVDRVIVQFTMEGEAVLDPFAGLGTVPYCAMALGRQGIGIELSGVYYEDALIFLRARERELAVPTLFDILRPVADEVMEAAE